MDRAMFAMHGAILLLPPAVSDMSATDDTDKTRLVG
jgi:hypothetical protein